VSFNTASALLRGVFLIDSEFAKSQLPVVLQMLKGNQGLVNTSSDIDKPKLPHKVNFAAHSDC
jgi:hypothetical protein